MKSFLTHGAIACAAALLAATLVRQSQAVKVPQESPAEAGPVASETAVILPAGNQAPKLIDRRSLWSSVESSDYREYITNLRSIGCPEATVADIIRADVAELFARRRAEVRRGAACQFWQGSEAVRSAIAALAAEEQAVLGVLLGQVGHPELREANPVDEHEGPNLAGLSVEKQTMVAAGWSYWERLREDLLSAANGRALLEEEELRLEQIEVERERWLGTVLPPEDREQFELHNSAAAERLRESLVGVEVTSDEFRMLFRERRSLDEAAERVAATGQGSVAEAAERFEQAAVAVLGRERFDRFQRGGDRDFQRFAQAAQANGWNWSSIESAWDAAKGVE